MVTKISNCRENYAISVRGIEQLQNSFGSIFLLILMKVARSHAHGSCKKYPALGPEWQPYPQKNINNLTIIIIIIDTCTIPCAISQKIHCLLDYLIQKIPSTEHHLVYVEFLPNICKFLGSFRAWKEIFFVDILKQALGQSSNGVCAYPWYLLEPFKIFSQFSCSALPQQLNHCMALFIHITCVKFWLVENC